LRLRRRPEYAVLYRNSAQGRGNAGPWKSLREKTPYGFSKDLGNRKYRFPHSLSPDDGCSSDSKSKPGSKDDCASGADDFKRFYTGGFSKNTFFDD
jgi:hypothetical protein